MAPAEGGIVCVRCSTHYPMDGGLPDFRVDRTFYGGPANRERVAQILRDHPHEAWIPTVRAIVPMLDRHSVQYRDLVGATSCPWTVLAGLTDCDTVLEIQCGSGGATAELARRAGRVFAMDMTPENLELARRRLAAGAVQAEVTLMAAGDAGRLPLQDASVDRVVLIGVLERAVEYGWDEGAVRRRDDHGRGASRARRNPTEAQVALLAEAFRVLKPGGRIFLVAENRFYYNYFGRVRDSITGLRGVSVMPRVVANLYSIALTRRDYRSYTYGGGTYRALLRRAGFDVSSTYDLGPDIHRIQEIRFAPPRGMRGSSVKRVHELMAHGLRCPSTLVAGYGFDAVKGRAAASALMKDTSADNLVSALRQSLGIRDERIRISSNGKVLITGAMHRQSVVVKIPLHADADVRAKRNYAFLRYLGAARQSRSYIPAVIGHGRKFHYGYYVESFKDGRLLCKTLAQKSYGSWLSAMVPFLDWLNPVADAARRPWLSVDEGPYSARMVSVAARLGGKLSCPELTMRALDVVTGLLRGLRFRSGVVQGDLNVENVMVQGGRVYGVIDWDDAYWNENPIFNAFNFIDCATQHLAPQMRPVSRVRRLATWPDLSTEERGFLESRYRRCGVDVSFHYGLVYWYWMQQASDRIDGQLLYDAAKLHDHYVMVLEDFVDRGAGMNVRGAARLAGRD